MKSFRMLAVAALAAGLVAQTGAANAAPDRNVELLKGQSTTWTSAAAIGLNLSNFGTQDDAVNPATCGKNAQNYCETTLVKLTNPLTEEACLANPAASQTRTATFRLTEFGPVPGPVTDFDEKIYASDASGTKGARVGSNPWATATPPAYEETETVPVQTTCTTPSKYYLMEVIYFFSPNASYRGTVTF